jgi:penicillin-binding protein 1A
MQTARYLFLSEQKNFARKLAELYLADYLEKHLTKRQILELYLTNVNFGMHTPGVARAARIFFGKTSGELTLSEVAFLVGNLPKPPGKPEEATAAAADVRRRTVLSRMQSYYPNVYSEADVGKALREKPVFIWQKQAVRREAP